MADSLTVFVTGGTGYIGSHCIVELLNAGYEVVTVDNLTNSRSEVLRRVEEITGKKVIFYMCNLLDSNALKKIFAKHKFHCVVHFAASKNVGESIKFPFLYYKNNLIGGINLFEAMIEYKVYNLVFSSSCTVYGDPEQLPLREDHPVGSRITNVYGRTKVCLEKMLQDLSYADPNWNIIALRYFNPVGAHPSGKLGEDNTGAYTNLMPFIAQVAIGRRPSLTVFGNDYNTPDGTGIRDYIHVTDLVEGHVLALKKLEQEHMKFKAYNLGIGHGSSVLDIVKHFERVSGKSIPLTFEPRREGDVARLICDGSLSMKELGWKPTRDIVEMCEDFWRFQTQNPNGYAEDEPFPPRDIEDIHDNI